MEVQNIVIDFENSTASSYVDGKPYKLELTQGMLDLKPNEDTTKVIIQLTEDQYGKGAEKRIIYHPSFEMIKYADLSKAKSKKIETLQQSIITYIENLPTPNGDQ